ncbi:hypothetical protein FN846DRAFT_978943 [Sphaerosporella brunnea]|uniref:Secreted protein n=1 Tax=Sphaerosporella brunnea TaxID=1250544 RepID=A0A5J5EEQ3_9PEZI|nr:hypothetical protein FN846DRAFT_978943 [Sphaerosporella brunnea]
MLSLLLVSPLFWGLRRGSSRVHDSTTMMMIMMEMLPGGHHRRGVIGCPPCGEGAARVREQGKYAFHRIISYNGHIIVSSEIIPMRHR